MKPSFFIRHCPPKKQEWSSYLALVLKLGDKTIFLSYDEALILKLCDYSTLSLLKVGEEIEI